MKAPQAMTCYKCKKRINKGSECMWIPDNSKLTNRKYIAICKKCAGNLTERDWENYWSGLWGRLQNASELAYEAYRGAKEQGRNCNHPSVNEAKEQDEIRYRKTHQVIRRLDYIIP